MMIGQVFKIHSDFYYVKMASDGKLLECKMREILKKQQLQIVVGDFVEVEQIQPRSNQAFISVIKPRNTFITRPKTANIDQIIIVSSVREPALNLNQLNRYISLCEYHKIKPVLCFNKNDLSEDDSIIEKIFQIYEPLNYDIVFTSAKEKTGLDDLEELLSGKTSALCGASGVGKSTIINTISNSNIKTNEISKKTQRGTHTTRHLEIFEIETSLGDRARIVDTPGFSHLRFDFIMPEKLIDLFLEMKEYRKDCKFSDCLHVDEADCNVLKNIDNINLSRYESYLQFLEEAKEYKLETKKMSIKEESNFKQTQNKTMAKISSRKRQPSRKNLNQNIE